MGAFGVAPFDAHAHAHHAGVLQSSASLVRAFEVLCSRHTLSASQHHPQKGIWSLHAERGRASGACQRWLSMHLLCTALMALHLPAAMFRATRTNHPL